MYSFKVEYYNDEHKRLLEKYSCSDEIRRVINDGLKVTEEEFFSYALFREQKNHDGWQTYQDLKTKIPNRLLIFKEYYSVDNGLLCSRFNLANDRENHLTESIGVGAGLVLISQLYGLTEADWERIPVSKEDSGTLLNR